MAATSDKWADAAKRHLKAELKRADVGVCRASAPADRYGLAGTERIGEREDWSWSVPRVVPVRRHARNWLAYLTGKGVVLAGVFALIFCLATLAVETSKQTIGNQAQTQAEQGQSHKETLWRPESWEPITWFTLALVAVGVVQSVVFLRQARRLRETIEKMDEVAAGQSADMGLYIKQATRSADAIADSAAANLRGAIAAEEAKNADRAWLFYTDVHHGIAITPLRNGIPIGEDGFVFWAQWTNGGRSPAVKCKLFLDHVIVTRDAPEPIFSVRDGGPGGAMIGPGASFSSARTFISHKNIIEYKMALYLSLRAEYYTISHPSLKRISEILVEITENGFRSQGDASQPLQSFDIRITDHNVCT